MRKLVLVVAVLLVLVGASSSTNALGATGGATIGFWEGT